jgi:hypothetical protein
MWRFAVVIVSLTAGPLVRACDFQYDPASVANYYRAEGWTLPGTTDFNPAETPRFSEAPALREIPGAVAQLLPHDEYPYIIEFPAQEFILNGSRKRMRPAQVKATIVRWKVMGKVVAYSYGLVPVVAHRVNGQWRIDSEVGCIFTATFVDDRGDGVFRVLSPGAFSTKLIPLWARPPKS